MRTAIAVFCKTPGFSSIKTRLGAEIGDADAEEFYRLSVLAIDEMLVQVSEKLEGMVDIYWAVGEQEALNNPIWKSHKRIWTGEGGLGERIHHVFEELLNLHEQVIIIGSDSPQITADYLITAIRRLQEKELEGVIGPCRDGGFVLFGTKRLIQKSILAKVTYSANDTLLQLTTLLKQANYKFSMLTGLGDVDRYDDLILLLNDFLQLGSLLQPRQLYLYHWVQRLLISKKFLSEIKSFHIGEKQEDKIPAQMGSISN
jgi:rSAM/selenodomain-associated transferase 1